MSYDVRNFETEVIQVSASIPVLVDFWAEWCGPCRALSPVLEKLAQRHEHEWVLRKVNTEELPDIAGTYGVRSIPNVKLFSKGSVVNEFVGALPESTIERWLQTALPDKFSTQLDEAETLIRNRKYDAARAILEPIAAAKADHERARALLALATLPTNRKHAVDLVSSLDASSKYFDTAETIRTFDRLMMNLDNPTGLPDSPVKGPYLEALGNTASGEYDQALALFIDVIRQDRYYDDDGSRKACIAIFRLLGEEHEVTVKHRRAFGNALYV